jgi:hypothetical protein
VIRRPMDYDRVASPQIIVNSLRCITKKSS